jgi:hypothetical protein
MTEARQIVSLGELVAAAYDQAAEYSADPNVVTRLAARAVLRVLRNAGRTYCLPPQAAAREPPVER